MVRRSPAILILGSFLFLLLLLLLSLETAARQPVSAAAGSVVVLVNDSFEGAFPPAGWSAEGHWGKSICEASSGTTSAWIEGSASDRGCNGFDKVYHPNETALLRYGPFDLSDALTATLSFDAWVWQQVGETYVWGASVDGLAFHGITVTNAFTTLWEAQSLDLAAVPGLGDLRGESAVYIGFLWQSDDFGETFGGAFVDNVRIAKGVAGGEGTATPTASRTPTATATRNVSGTQTTARLYLPAISNAPPETPLPTATATQTATPTPTATNGPGNHAPIFPTPFLATKTTELEYDNNGRLIGAVTTITIQTPATDQDGDAITYGWAASNGSITGSGLVGTWTRVIESGRVQKGTVTVTASDGRGDTAQVSFEVN